MTRDKPRTTQANLPGPHAGKVNRPSHSPLPGVLGIVLEMCCRAKEGCEIPVYGKTLVDAKAGYWALGTAQF